MELKLSYSTLRILLFKKKKWEFNSWKKFDNIYITNELFLVLHLNPRRIVADSPFVYVIALGLVECVCRYLIPNYLYINIIIISLMVP